MTTAIKNTKNVANEMERLYNELVPSMGKAETEAGEILRAFGRINYRFLNDGDMIGVDYGNETCNAAARYLVKHVGGNAAKEVNLIWGYDYTEAYKRFLDATEKAVYQYLLDHPEAFTNGTEDFWTLSTYEDTHYCDDEEDEDGWDW